jgi:hypothetical protein
MAKGVGLRLLSRRGSWVQIPPSAPQNPPSGFFNTLVCHSVMSLIAEKVYTYFCFPLKIMIFLSNG